MIQFFTPIHTLDDLTAVSETVELECKLAQGRDGKGTLPKDFWKTYSAFANTQGGLVLLGVKENQGGRFSVEKGIISVEPIRKDLFNTLNNPQKVNINLLSDQHFHLLELEGRQVIAIQIPRASRKQRPVFLNLDVQVFSRLTDFSRQATIARYFRDGVGSCRPNSLPTICFSDVANGNSLPN